MDLIKATQKLWNLNAPWQWITAALIATGMVLLGLLARRWIRGRYARLAETEEVELMEVPLEVLGKTSTAFIVAACTYLGLYTLSLPTTLQGAAKTIFTITAFWQLGLWASAALLGWISARRKGAADRASAGSLGIIGFMLQLVVWTLVLLLTLDNLGINITALVAGLGVGGIAVALAVQNVLGDLFASLSITLDRPFVIGDFVVVGEYMGSVEQIGVKSTRLRSLGGEQIVLSNADLLSSRVRNYGRMAERRVAFKLGVTYETPHALLLRVPAILRACVEHQPETRFDRSHFANYGDFALEFETVYYVLSADYNRFMDLQQAIYFEIHERFEQEHIEFAYPTQKVWLSGTAASASKEMPAEGGSVRR